MPAKPRRMGRPLKGNERGKTKSITIRMTPELRQRIDQAAENGRVNRTLEIERRLQRSFNLDDERKDMREGIEQERLKMFESFGGEQNYAVCLVFASLMKKLNLRTGRNWVEDKWTYNQFALGVRELLRRWSVQPNLFDDGQPMKAPELGCAPDLVDRQGELIVNEIFEGLPLIDKDLISRDARIKRGLGELAYRDADIDPPWQGGEAQPLDPTKVFKPIPAEDIDALDRGAKKGGRHRKG